MTFSNLVSAVSARPVVSFATTERLFCL